MRIEGLEVSDLIDDGGCFVMDNMQENIIKHLELIIVSKDIEDRRLVYLFKQYISHFNVWFEKNLRVPLLVSPYEIRKFANYIEKLENTHGNLCIDINVEEYTIEALIETGLI